MPGAAWRDHGTVAGSREQVALLMDEIALEHLEVATCAGEITKGSS